MFRLVIASWILPSSKWCKHDKAGSECVGIRVRSCLLPFPPTPLLFPDIGWSVVRHEEMSSTASETIYLVTGATRGRFNLPLFLFSHLPTFGYSYVQSRICFD